MTTRAASAAFSLRAKQDLVRILFGPKNSNRNNGPELHRLMDHSIYTYNDLKREYLKRIQTLHPDKRRSERNDDNNEKQQLHGCSEIQSNESNSSDFVELQDAWKKYEGIAKLTKRTNRGLDDNVEGSFTMFGVGCSFSDNDTEREIRNEIMDQASKGWFPSGEIGCGKHDNRMNHNSNDQKKSSFHDRIQQKMKPLLNEDFFEESGTDLEKSESCDVPTPTRSSRSSLVDHLIPLNRR